MVFGLASYEFEYDVSFVERDVFGGNGFSFEERKGSENYVNLVVGLSFRKGIFLVELRTTPIFDINGVNGFFFGINIF